MGNLKSCFIVATIALAACGSDKAKTPDAPIHVIDAAIDAPVHMIDAPPDAPNYNFSCFGMANPTTAADPITIAGTTETFSMSGVQTVPNVAVDIFKSGTANPVDSQTSSAQGAFTSGNIATGGTPLDGYIKAGVAAYRTTYLYPPTPAVASLMNVPVIMLSTANFTLLTQFASVTQDDANNGVLFLTVTDCNNMPINGATLSVKQNGADVGTQFDLGQLAQQAAGIVIVFNVPDGATDISASYNSMTFPMRSVLSHKKPNGANSVGTITATAVRPGP